jgi:hypothetical protein
VTSEEEKPTPREFDWAEKVYKRMLEHAEPTEAEDTGLGNTRDMTIMVYKGHLTKLFAELEVPNPYYTKIMGALKQDGCVEQLRRGGGAAMSEWILHHEPREEAFRDRRELRSHAKGKVAELEQRVRDQQNVIRDLVEKNDEMLSLVATVEGRVDDLKQRVNDLESQVHETKGRMDRIAVGAA